MRPGDLVESKAGSHGIGAPHNYGIYLDRVKRKGAFDVMRPVHRRKPQGHRPPADCR